MLDVDEIIDQTPFRVTDLKQWVYCPRILYYYHCLPAVRPETYKMEAGAEAGKEEAAREARRSLAVYGLADGEREFNVTVASAELRLRGEVDLVITAEVDGRVEVMPVDYKLARRAGPHYKLQLAAYGRLLELTRGCFVRRGFLYYIPLRRAEAVNIDRRLREKLAAVLADMRLMLESEKMPAPTPQIRKCAVCEFRRFCNDVL